jgi:hypothetical protein
MSKSLYLNYSSDVSGNKPYKFVVPLDQTLKLNSDTKLALHNVDITRPLIVLDQNEEFIISLNQFGTKDIITTQSIVDPDNPTQTILFSGGLSKILEPSDVYLFETSQFKKSFNMGNQFYMKLLPNIKVKIPKGIYSKNNFLEILANEANKALISQFRAQCPQFYNTLKFAVVNDGSKTFLGLYNFCNQMPVRISSASATDIPNIVNSNNLNDDNISSIKVADFDLIPGNLAYPSTDRFLVNSEITIALDDDASPNWDTFAFVNSSINVLNNKQDNLTDRQNSGLQASFNFNETGQDEYLLGFLSQAYQMTNWTNKAQPDLYTLKNINSIEIPKCYCGIYFRKETDGVFIHVIGTSNPYYAVDTFTNPDDPVETGRYTCYRNSITPIEDMIVLYSTFIPTTSTSGEIEKAIYGIELYYRYSTNSKTLVYQNADLNPGADFIAPGKYSENARVYFRVYCSNGIDSKTNNRVLFDSKTIDYYFSHELLNDNYRIINPNNYWSATLNNGAKRDLLANTGIAGGFVPFLAAANVDESDFSGFYNCCFNPTRLFDYNQARNNAELWDEPANITRPDLPIPYVPAYRSTDLNRAVPILGKSDYLPIGIYSYGFSNLSPTLAKVLGGINFSLSEIIDISIEKMIELENTNTSQSKRAAFDGYSPNRFAFDVNAELGLFTLFSDGNKYHIIIKNIPLDVLANIKDTGPAKRQNIIYTLRQTDLNISQVETNNLQISHYCQFPKFLSIYNKGEINLQYIEVEIRNADTGKYAEEITDCSLEILFNQN